MSFCEVLANFIEFVRCPDFFSKCKLIFFVNDLLLAKVVWRICCVGERKSVGYSLLATACAQQTSLSLQVDILDSKLWSF